MAPQNLESIGTADLRKSVEHVSIPTDAPEAEFTNWAKTFRCKPQRVFAPTTIEECRAIMELARREGARLHPVGVGHSPSDLACTNGWLLRMEGLKGFISVSSCSGLVDNSTTAYYNRQTRRGRQRPFTAVRLSTRFTAVFSSAIRL